MGVNLRDLVPKTLVSLKDLAGKSIAIDAYNALYQFLAIIRQPDGTPLKDHTGRVTSHLSGLFYRTCNLLEMGIKVIYVFDGTPPALKETEIKRRSQVKDEALKKYEEALKMGKIEEARMYAQMTSRLKDYMAEDAKRLLTLMGVPWVQAPSEGEAQAAYMVKKGDADYCASQDYDSLLFGAPHLLRNVTISGRRKLPRKRVGPKKALKLIKEYGSLEAAIPKLKDAKFPVDPRKIKEIFLNPEVTENYSIVWKDVDMEGVIRFLCGEKDFSESRVRKALEKAVSGSKKARTRRTLEEWF